MEDKIKRAHKLAKDRYKKFRGRREYSRSTNSGRFTEYARYLRSSARRRLRTAIAEHGEMHDAGHIRRGRNGHTQRPCAELVYVQDTSTLEYRPLGRQQMRAHIEEYKRTVENRMVLEFNVNVFRARDLVENYSDYITAQALDYEDAFTTALGCLMRDMERAWAQVNDAYERAHEYDRV